MRDKTPQRRALSEARQSLTVELLGYVLLRLTRHFTDSEYQLFSEMAAEDSEGRQTTHPFDLEAQRRAVVGAYVHRNTVSAFNRSRNTFEDIGILENITGFASKIMVPFERLAGYLAHQGALDETLFDMSLYHFYTCHEQTEWGSPSWNPLVHGTEVSIRPGLKGRFERAGLLALSEAGHVWSQLMLDSVSPIVPDTDAKTFFEQIYTFEETDD